jgi:hypothetical protein
MSSSSRQDSVLLRVQSFDFRVLHYDEVNLGAGQRPEPSEVLAEAGASKATLRDNRCVGLRSSRGDRVRRCNRLWPI